MTTKHSIKTNAMLNMVRIALGVLFPLITYPYATRILGVDNIGKVQFGLSIISYFSLLAALGVNTYGIRQGAAIKDDKQKFSLFANELFSINILSSCISYFILIMLLIIPNQLSNYRLLIFIQSLTIIFNTLGVDWIFSAKEDFLYITIRTIIIQLISIVLLFILIKQPNDYYLYAMITTVSTAGSGTLNFFYARKYCQLHFTTKLNLKKHIKPLLALFGSAIAVQIYINSDVVMLGIMQGSLSVGLYSVPVKIYTIIKSILNATIAVSIPRFSYYVANMNITKLKQLSSKIINISIITILPCIILLFLLSQQIIYIISGTTYIDGAISLQILSLALPFAVASNFLGNAILVSHRLEKKFLIATAIGASFNIVLNFIFIPLMAQNGAAITTVIAEIGVMAACGYFCKGLFGSTKTKLNILQSLIGCCGIIITFLTTKILLPNSKIVTLVITSVLGLLLYTTILYCQQNETIIELMKSIKNKAKSINKNRLKNK